jgi:hypothetical protein
MNCYGRLALHDFTEHCAECFLKDRVSMKKNPLAFARMRLKRKEEAGLCELCGMAKSGQCSL